MAGSVLSSVTKDNSSKRNEASVYQKLYKSGENSDSKFPPSEIPKEI